HVMRFAEMTQDVLITRPTPVSTPTILGLKSGRGNIYREAVKQAKEQRVPVSEILAPVVYSLGPEFPQLIVHTSDDESVYINLIEFLGNRIARRNSFVQDLVRRQEDFRKNLMDIDKENVQLKQEKIILQMDLDAREQQVRSLERKLSASEQTVEMLQKQLSDAKNEVEAAKFQMSTKDKILSEQEKEVQHVKLKMQEKLALEKDRMRRIMEKRLAAKQAELERKMCITDEKFRQLREILNADDWEYYGDIFGGAAAAPAQSSVTSSSTYESTKPETRSSKRHKSSLEEPSVPETKFSKAKSAFDLGVGKQNASTFQADTDYTSGKENKPPSTSQRSIAIANPRHRRSQSSSGDVWIEHKPVGNLELNTVLQPTMRKKKSVSKLEVKDVMKSDVSKYVLEHQEQDSQGEVETQLYKADVIPSAGGGVQVVFNDVEKLRQVSPPAYNLRLVPNFLILSLMFIVEF
ncbi:kinesin-like protein KIF23, partial [Stegodyphus dumicola]|uniref:kinesin-like protein KIF23 n=1 Tax=Stegodyphus dumicola TaxID=202533 RepID=UPI0015AF2E3D